jgi:segregation and condensation protein B
MNDQTRLPETQAKQIIEALLFVSPTPISVEQIQAVLEDLDPKEIRTLVEALRQDYQAHGHSFGITEVAGGFQLTTDPVYAPWLRGLLKKTQGEKLSGPSMETLAIVAYKQPVSRPDVDAIRGVNSEAVLDNLMEKRMIRIAGRKEAPGRPFLYETTREFLVAFGLRDLADLPKVEGELVVPELAGVAEHGEAETQQDPGAGGADVPAGG